MVLESNTLDVLFVKDGQQGEDGKVLYTWIKYAKDANGTGITDDPNGAVYIGISYNNESSIESNDPTHYAWTKIQGADGKKGEDAYTIFLENENISFATDKNRNPLSEQAYTSGITIMKGAKPVTDFTIGDIAKTQGIAVAKTDTAIAISVVNGNPLPNDSGEIEIPVTVGGTVFKKILTWTCAKKGEQGEKGEQGIQGPQGEQGIAGKDGTSVTITNKSITYQLSTSGTTIPTGTWQTTPQAIPEGQYQWTKTFVTYSDGNKTESYSISYHGKNGSDGTSVKTTSTSVKYQVGDSGTTKPTGTWQSNVPTVAQGKYLWTQTIVNYSDGNSTESYSVSYRGIDGSNGVNGMNVATIYLYQRATSTPGKPSNTLTYTFSTTKITGTLNNGWSTAIPTGTDAVYVTVASVSSKNDTATIATSAWSAPVVLAQNGKTGSDGKAGLNVATIYLYQRATSKPSKPSASVTYTFNTGVASGLNNGWSQKIPDGTNPLYVTLATASSNTATDTVLSSEWSDVVVMAQNGEDGQDGTSITITSKSVTYQASSSGTTTPTGTWSTSVPTVNNGQYLWTKTTVQYSDDNKTEAYSVSYKGTNGTNGTSVTVSKTEVTYQVSTSGTTAPTGTWSTTMPTCDQGLYLWTKTYVKYSDGKDTTSYAVSYKGIDGEKFAFNMLRETNQGSKHWVNLGASGKYSVESITTDDNINAAKLICTEAIASNEWQFCDFSDYEMLKSLKASTTYTLSYDIKANRSGKILHNIKTGGGQKVFFANDIACKVLGNETWEHVSLKMTSGTTLPNLDGQVIYMFGDALSKVGYSIIKNLKLTEGIVDTPWAPHPEDLEGRGVSETVQYYLATSQASGVTSSTSGWSTDITTQKLTADKKYLWNCYQTKYSDGTSEPISTPKVIGVYGDKGNGIVASVQRPNKTEFWWSQVGAVGHKDTFDDSSNTRNNCRVGDIFTVMGTSTEGNSHTVYYKSTTDSGDLAGECINHVVAESGADAKNLTITPSSQYFKSTDGGKTFAPNQITIKPTIQGEISFGKWQYSIDGGVSFADIVSGQKGLTISNNVLSISKDSSLYSDAVTMVTFRAVANDSSFYDTCSIAKIYDVSDIGDGRNLIQKSQLAPIDSTDLNLDDYSKNGTVVFINKSVNSGFSFDKYNNYQSNSKYVLSYYFTKTSGTINSFGGFHNGKRVVYTSFFVDDKVYDTASYAGGSSQIGTILNDGKRHRIVVCYTTPDTIATDTSVNYTFIQPGRGNTNPNFGVKIEELKLEKGSSPTGWSAAPEDLQTAILSTKSEISDVSLKVDKNKQAIEQRVEKTTYQQDLNLVKGDISKANEGLNKWRYEIYPKSLFADKPEDQSKYDIGVFIRNKNLTPSRTLVFDDNKWTLLDYENNYIGYGLTFVKMSAKKTFSTKWAHSSSCSIYVNGKLIISDKGTVRLDSNNTGRDFSCTFIEGWNCIEFVMQETIGNEWFFFKDAISAISECQLMNCYYGTPVARQSHITNQLVQNTTDIDGVSGSVQKVMSTVGGSGKVDEFVNNYSTWKKKVDGIETRVGKTYVTKNDFDGLEIGGVNLFVKSTASRGWWISDTGVLNANGGWGYSDYINVSGMKNYIASGFTNLGISPATCFYDSNKTFISGVQSTNQNSQDSKRKTLPIPSNAKYMRFSFMLVDIDTLKIEQGTKATAYSPAPEDDEINGQNLVSNLPSNWEQGTVTVGSTTGTTYANTKSSSAGSVRPKELIPVSGNITISTAYSNQSKKPIRHWIAAYDVNKNYLGNNYVSNAWNSFPRTLNMKDAKYIAIMVGYTDSSAITPSDISQICLKIERGTSATPFTLAPEDVNGKIVNVETIANQTAKKFSWIVKSGTSSSNFEITDRLMNLVSANINLDGIVSFMNTAKGDGRKNLYNLDYSSFENVASQKDAICYAKDNGVTSVSIDSSVSYDGNKSLKISYTTANLNSSTTPLYLGSSANNYGCVKIQAGKQYLLSCYVKSDSATGLFMIDIQGHDTPDTKTDGLYLSNIDPRKLPGSSTGVNLSTDWQRAICAIKVADNATGLYWSVVPLIWGKPSSSNVPQTFNVWVDCIMLEEVDSISNEPGTYILDKETIIDGGSVKADTITGNQILAGSITADKIATDAIKSHNYISSGGTQGSFLNLGDGSFTSPNLSWDSNGNLIAKNANLSGEITATNGSIAGWTIISNKMYTTGSGKYTGIGKYGSAYAFWAGATSNDNGNSAVFKVSHTGKLTATDADITGTITATNGKIGRYDITSTYLMTNSRSNASGIGGNQAFWAGAEDSNSAPFRVGYDGVLWAENAAIRGSIETGNLGDEGDTVSITNGHIGIQGPANNVEIYSTGFKFGIDGEYYLMSVSEGVKCYRNLYATDFVADGWLYCSEVHSSGAVIIGADSESFYWAHGYQIARGTSWGGVCVGDDSQQLRLYGSSIWASHSISTSDENLKENFTTLDQYENFYMNLNPIGFNYIGDYDGKKTHFGFGAHKTEDVLESEGYDADKFAVVTHRPLVQEDIEKRFGKDVEVDIETEYGVSYTEFIALNTHMIQKTRRELTKVKQEKADLEVRLQAIEAKLGL